MINVYDTANKLAQEIRNSEEYLKYKKAKDAINSNVELKSKVEEFDKKRYEAQLALMNGKQEDGDNQKLQELYAILIQNKEIKEYFDLEIRFNVMIADINKIIAESIKDVI